MQLHSGDASISDLTTTLIMLQQRNPHNKVNNDKAGWKGRLNLQTKKIKPQKMIRHYFIEPIYEEEAEIKK